MPRRIGKYVLGKTLGEGTFGKVKLAVADDGEKVAIKILDKESIQKQKMGTQVKREISIMKALTHRHVVNLKEVLASRSKIFLVLEMVTGGELFDRIVAEGRFKEEDARFYFRQLIGGIMFCHEEGVAHRDLKPENLLLDESGNLKISDFGLSAFTTGQEGGEARQTLLHTTCGTPNYVAPEVLEDQGYDGKHADIWSCGVILYVLLAGFLPFDEPTMSALFEKIQRASYTTPAWFSDSVKDLLGKILVTQPTERITLAEIKAHPWFIEGGGLQEFEESFATASVAAVDEGSAMSEVAGGADDEAADDADPTTPVQMNAFDLINIMGGMTMSRLVSFRSGAEAGGSKHATHAARFLTRKPASAIIEIVKDAFTHYDFELEKENLDCYKLRYKNQQGAQGIVIASVQVFVLLDSLHLLEIKRIRGSIIRYSDLINAHLEELKLALNGM